MNKHFRRLQEADYVPVSLNDKEMMDPSSLSLKSVAKRNKDDADRAEAEAAKKVVRAENAKKYSEVEAILNQTLDKGKQPSDVLDAVFDTGIVPGSGKADTKAGEIIRAMMRVIYRYYNDGDKFFEGYGLETAAPSIAYLIDTIDEVATYVGNMMERLYDYDSDAKYNDAIETLADICLHHIQAHFDELMDPNEEDSRDWSGPSLEEIEENQPKYEYDVWGSDDIVVLVENGILNAWDLKEYVEDMMHWEQAFKGAEIDRPWSHTSTELNITNLTKDGYDLIRDWFHNREEQFWEDLVEQYRDDLDAIYNEDSEDEGDEDIDESLKEARYDGVETKLRRLMNVYEDDGHYGYDIEEEGNGYRFYADWGDVTPFGGVTPSFEFFIDDHENWRLFKFEGWYGDDGYWLQEKTFNDIINKYSKFFSRSQLAYIKKFLRTTQIEGDDDFLPYFEDDIYSDESKLNPFWQYGNGWEDLIDEISSAYPIYGHYDYIANGDEKLGENVKKEGIKLVPDQLVDDIHIDASGQSVGIAGGTGGSVSNTGHTSNSTNNSKKLTEKSRNPQIRKIEIDLAKELGKNNLKLNPEEMDLETAAEYIYMSGANTEYTVQDWIKDTKENYPECFLNESVKEAYKSDYELARPNMTAILNALDNGLTNPTTLILQLLKWIPDDTLKDFVKFYGYGSHDEDIDEDIKLVFQPELKKG